MDWQSIWNTVSNFFVNGGFAILKLLGALILGLIVIKLVKLIIKRILEKTKIEKLGRQFITQTVVCLLWLMLIIWMLDIIGIPITGVIAAFSAVALAIALALKDSLSSLANGVILIFTKPFKQGDVININNTECIVKELRLFNTIVETYDNRRLIIPNKDMIANTIENLYTNPTRRISIPIKLSYRADVEKFKKVAIETMLSNPLVLTDPAPIIVLEKLDDSTINFDVRCWTLSTTFSDVKNDMIEKLFNELKRNDIPLSYNQLEVRLIDDKVVLPFDKTPLQKRDTNVNPKIDTENDENDIFDFKEIVKKQEEYSKKWSAFREKRKQKAIERQKRKAEKLAKKQNNENKISMVSNEKIIDEEN